MRQKINIILPIVLAVFLPILGMYTHSSMDDIFGIDDLLRWLIVSVVLYSLWYAVFFGEKFFRKDKVMGIVLTIVVVTVIIVSSVLLLNKAMSSIIPSWLLSIRLINVTILFLIIQYALKANSKIAKLQLEKEQVQTENYKIQLASLQTKVAPHFLFNSLNTLRSLVHNQHDDSEKFIMSLSDFYRHTLKYDESSVITLAEELEVLKSYLYLMQVRNKEALIIDLQVDESLLQYSIPNFALQIVVENCFKHNIASLTKPLKISIHNLENVYISIKNNVQPKLTSVDKSGYGLSNILKRYKLLGVKNGLVVTKNEEYFEVKLKLV